MKLGVDIVNASVVSEPVTVPQNLVNQLTLHRQRLGIVVCLTFNFFIFILIVLS